MGRSSSLDAVKTHLMIGLRCFVVLDDAKFQKARSPGPVRVVGEASVTKPSTIRMRRC